MFPAMFPASLIVDGNAKATANPHRGLREALSPRYRGPTHLPDPFYLRGPGSVRSAQGVHPRHASLMLTLVVVSIPIAFLNELNAIAALVLVRGADFLSIFEKPQRDAMAMQFLNLHNHGFGLAAIFWGLWLFPLGLLVYRSGFLPRILGVLLMVNCFAYPVTSFTSLLLPQYEDIVSR
jgi:hypothetical protein